MATPAKGETAYNHFSDWLNGASAEEKRKFVQQIMTEHRDLQNEIFFVCLGLMQSWRDMGRTGHFDARNQEAVRASTVMLNAINR